MAITNDGLYAWGVNSSGQLGDGTTTDRYAPVKVVFPPTVVTVTAIAAGSYHSMAITNDGLYAWGSNGSGALGDGTRTNRIVPVKVTFPPAVVRILSISGGGFHSLAITDDGVYAWGNNTFGQLGDGTTTTQLVPTKVLYSKTSTPTTVSAIAAGFWHSLAIGDGSIFGWGYNGNGELGSGTGASTAVPVRAAFPKRKTPIVPLAIAAGSMHGLAITSDGLYAWGNNSNGQLTGPKSSNIPLKVRAESNVIAIGAGYYHSLALH